MANSTQQRGFTLIEIMIVIVIVGVIIAVATLSLPGARQTQGQLAQRLQQTITAAQQQAIMNNRSLRMTFVPRGFYWQALSVDPQSWLASQTVITHWQSWHDGAMDQLHFFPYTIELAMGASDNFQALTSSSAIHVDIAPSGLVSSFSIVMKHNEKTQACWRCDQSGVVKPCAAVT